MTPKLSLFIFFFFAPLLLVGSCYLLLDLSLSNQPPSKIPQILGLNIDIDTYNFLPEIKGSANSADARALIIKKYLHSYNSPLEPYAQTLVTTSDKYALDYRLLVAIAQQESNLCKKIPENSFNCWGYGIYGDLVTRFKDYPQGIDIVAKGLRKNYLDKGLDTPEEIMAVYTPPSKGSWARGVTQFLQELE